MIKKICEEVTWRISRGTFTVRWSILRNIFNFFVQQSDLCPIAEQLTLISGFIPFLTNL